MSGELGSPYPNLRVRRNVLSQHPSVYPIIDLTNELARQGILVHDRTSVGDLAGRLALKVGLARHIHAASPVREIRPMMAMQPWHLFPTVLWRRSILICWDVWLPDYAEWYAFFRRVRPEVVFMTARQSVEYFAPRLTETRVEWLPEATDPRHYDAHLPLKERTDVLEMGRRHDSLHSSILGIPESAGFAHRYERRRGELVFSDRKALATGLARTAVSVCLPSSMTHPERSGDVEVLTHRYLETMASGAVLWGHAPSDLIDLFGYNPVVEIEWDDPAVQLAALLADVDAHQHLVARNMQVLIQRGTWNVRVRELLSRLSVPST